MKDAQIIELFWQRDETALTEVENKYANYCFAIAWKILMSREDSEECVNDTWLAAWNTIPPKRPSILSSFLGRITRNFAISNLRKKYAAKRPDMHMTNMDNILREVEVLNQQAAQFSGTYRIRRRAYRAFEWIFRDAEREGQRHFPAKILAHGFHGRTGRTTQPFRKCRQSKFIPYKKKTGKNYEEGEISEMKNDQFLFLDILGQIDDTFIEASSQPWKEEKAATGESRRRTPHRGFLHIRSRWHIVAVMILLVAMSMAVLANDDIREGLRQLRLQFFTDNVTIDSVQEDASQQIDSTEEETSGEEFRAYKWKEVPEGYYTTFEEENPEFGYYIIEFENDSGNFIHYVQNDALAYTSFITYDNKEGYQRQITLGELQAYSISDGRRNTIFYEKDGYLFEFMSNQPEEVIIDYINVSGILEYEY